MKEKIENTIEKIGDTVLGKELESEIGKVEQKQESKKVEQEETGEKKNINQRIEDLVNEMEKTNSLIAKVFSLKSAFIRGLLQGLGIIIGSTILAGALYSMTVKLFGNDFLKDVVLDNVIEKYKQEGE